MTDDEFLNDRDIPNSGPRTDAVKFEIRWRNGEYRVTRPGIKTMEVVPAEEMAKLEAELAAASAELAKYKENLQEMSNDWAASDEKLRAELADNERALKLCRAWSSRAEKAEAELERAMKVVRAGIFWKKHDAPVGGSAWALLGAVEEWEAGR